MRFGSFNRIVPVVIVLNLGTGCEPDRQGSFRVLDDDGEILRVTLHSQERLAASDLRDDRIIVWGPGNATPGCTVDDVVEKVRALFAAVEDGRAGIGTDFFTGPSHPSWGWYRINHPTQRGDSYYGEDLADLDRYFADRHLQHEQLRLAALHLNSPNDGIVAFVLYFWRSAADLPEGTHLYAGKATLECEEGRFIHMNVLAQV